MAILLKELTLLWRNNMGCLKNIFKAIILALAVIGFISIGGKDFIVKHVDKFLNPPQETMVERAQKVGDFSQIPEEYEIDKTASVLGYTGVLAEHNASGQKMVVIDSAKKPILTPQDFKNGTVEEKIQEFLEKTKYQFIAVKDLKITKKGYLKAYGKTNPYVAFDAGVSKLPIDRISGIISAVQTEDGSSKVIVSVNEEGKYSQIIAEEFFRSVK
jgi:hypothetical protein